MQGGIVATPGYDEVVCSTYAGIYLNVLENMQHPLHVKSRAR